MQPIEQEQPWPSNLQEVEFQAILQAYENHPTSSSLMTNSIAQQIIGIQLRSPRRLLSAESNSKNHFSDQLSNASSLTKQVRLGPKITEILKRRLSLGAKLLQVGGATKVFKQNFNVLEGEKLVKAFRCYLSTTTGPIAGLLFISTNKVAFCSEKLLAVSSPTGELVKVHYKVSIPLTRITKSREGRDVNRPSKKYVEIVTTDNFDFWFMGLPNQQRTLKHLQQAISPAHQ